MTRLTEDWLQSPATARVFDAIEAAGHQLWFVGGCVRNALMGLPAGDIDLATDATPEAVQAACKAKGLRVVPTGIDHGTVTVVSDGVPHEVTTFRKDVQTDGRRARVTFTTDMTEDARRRDFTMNALYADRAGRVVDPLGAGLDDLRARRIRFIDDPADRIREDYLRILRFFRFHAWYGDPAAGLDPAALDAIARNLDGLDRLSAERVGSEMLRLLAAPDPVPAVAAMEAAHVLGRVLPGASARFLGPLVQLEDGRAPDPIRRLVALGGPDPSQRLRLSRKQARAWKLLTELAGSAEPIAVMGYRHGADAALDAALLRAAMTGAPLPPDAPEQARHGAAQVFPLRAADLQDRYSGKALGARLRELEARWIASGFALGKDALLAG